MVLGLACCMLLRVLAACRWVLVAVLVCFLRVWFARLLDFGFYGTYFVFMLCWWVFGFGWFACGLT